MSGEPDGPAAEPVRPAQPADDGPGRRRVGLFAAIAVAVLVLDIVSKLLVVAYLPPDHAAVRVLGGLIYVQQTRNSGAAFSLGTGFTVILTAVAVIVAAVIVRAATRLRSVGWAISLGLILGGAVGNLIDRFFRDPGVGKGHVVDWISPFAPYGERFAIFNLADSGIVCGAILAAILALRNVELDGRRSGRHARPAESSRPSDSVRDDA